MVRDIIRVEQYYRELDKRADTLSLTLLVAQRGSAQSSTHAEGGLVSNFFCLSPQWHQTSPQSWQLRPWPSRQRMRFWNSHMLHVYLCCRRGKGVGLGPNSISNLARKLGLVVYLMNSSVSVNTILMNICYLFNELLKK